MREPAQLDRTTTPEMARVGEVVKQIASAISTHYRRLGPNGKFEDKSVPG